MSAAPPKTTSYAYGEAYQREQIEKHRTRATNHWRDRIALAHSLVDKWALPRLGDRRPQDTRVLDVGCSVGTMAIEFALRGFRAAGIDFDAAALAIAQQLCAEEGVAVELFQGDVAEWRPQSGDHMDIVLCFDIFEHLQDDELGSMLQSIRRLMSASGTLIFYSFPLQFDYLFFSRDFLSWPLAPFRRLAPQRFERLTRAYASLLDSGLLLTTGKNYKERIKPLPHCNPTTRERLRDILQRAGFEIACIETTNIYADKPHIRRRFSAQPIAHRQVYGAAWPCAQPARHGA
jgi:2-polyprenyl-3-methyl-5-hydroxy-6-metoxy-1,4-benzoquinol methylase